MRFINEKEGETTAYGRALDQWFKAGEERKAERKRKAEERKQKAEERKAKRT
jgi:hypothetical protein